MIPMHDVDSGAVIVTVAGGDFVETFLNRLWMKERKTENASNRKPRILRDKESSFLMISRLRPGSDHAIPLRTVLLACSAL